MIEARRGSAAIISDDKAYRYFLQRTVAQEPGIALFIMLNPSTADHLVDDPTIRRCLSFVHRWEFGQMHVINLFSYRATDPIELLRVEDPFGPDHETHVRSALETLAVYDGPKLVICAWGTGGAYIGAEHQMKMILRDYRDRITPMCFDTTKHGHPRHPLYLKKDADLVPYRL